MMKKHPMMSKQKMHHDHKKCAPECDDQLPTIATVGRGPQGDSSFVQVADPDSCTETHIEGWRVDEVTGEMIADSYWITENINGGELKYQYNLRPYTNPRTFTITFVYLRPGRCEWSWTTPAIPYIWTVDNEDGSVSEKPDHIVGSGVATLFVRTTHDAEWNERLHYPIDPDTGEPYPREFFNAPEAEEPWSSTITFGFGGDIEIPDFDDIAKILGVTKEDIYNILQDNSVTINGIEADNIIDYIDKCDKRDLDHIHKDLGFCDSNHGDKAFDGDNTVKEYIDRKIAEINKNINVLMKNIAKLIYGATADEDGNISIPEGTKIPTGSINVLSSDRNLAILTHDGTKTGDVRTR